MRASVLLLLFTLPLAAEVVQIGDGNLTNQGLPIEAARVYSYSQQLYLASEIGFSGVINSLSFQYNIASNIWLGNSAAWKIWLGQTGRDSLNFWVPLDSLSLAFDGVLDAGDFSGALPGQGWLTINLDTPFFYDSQSNLLLAVDENMPGSSSTSDEFMCSQWPNTRGLIFNSMSVNPDPASPPATGFYLRNAFANLRLDLQYFSYTPYQPQPADQTTGVDVNTGFFWQSDATNYDLYLGTSAQALNLKAENLTQEQWFPDEPLQLLQTYFWQVIAHHEGSVYPGPVWSFSTRGEGIGPPRNLSGYYIGDHVQLTWDEPASGNPTLYRIYRDGLFLATGQACTYQDFEVATGENYYYYVRAENYLGELSVPSNTVTVHIPGNIPDLILQEGFEACAPFSQTVSGWQNLDLDGAVTWSWDELDFPGEGGALGWLSFFPSQTTPPLNSIAAHDGAAMLVSMSSLSPPSNDWLISPNLNLGSDPALSFWARSHTADFGLERLRVLISGTDAEPASFSQLNSGSWLSLPAEWTQYAIDLDAWQGQNVYLAFQSVSWDAFALYLDDIVVTGAGGSVAAHDDFVPAVRFSVFPNPCAGSFRIANPGKDRFDLAIYDLRGGKIYSAENLAAFDSAERSLDLPSGIYLLKIHSGKHSQIQRLAVIK